jgi:hypothetical protein
MPQLSLEVSLSGDDLRALFRAVLAEPLFGEGTPKSLMIDGDVREPSAGWADAPFKNSLHADFDPSRWAALTRDCVKAATRWPGDVDSLMALIARLPATLVTVRSIYPEWGEGDLRLPFRGFGNGHFAFGSFAAFKGKGHERLVSRRWLEHAGPWVLHRGEPDVSLLQFHDLAADARTAFDQAKRAHERLGPTDTGGLFEPNFRRKLKLDGEYSGRDKRFLSVVGPHRQVAPREMLELGSLRGAKVGNDPVERAGLLYVDEPVARRDLHEVWLHELECWTYLAGRKARIDEDYSPPPPQRPW